MRDVILVVMSDARWAGWADVAKAKEAPESVSGEISY
jgi:hypothetical protein